MPSAPSRGTPWESQVNFRDGTVSGLYKGPVGTPQSRVHPRIGGTLWSREYSLE